MSKSIMQQTADHIEMEKQAREALYSEEGRENIYDAKCPVCGKNFVPAPFHVYKNKKGKLVCSYHCQLNA